MQQTYRVEQKVEGKWVVIDSGLTLLEAQDNISLVAFFFLDAGVTVDDFRVVLESQYEVNS